MELKPTNMNWKLQLYNIEMVCCWNNINQIWYHINILNEIIMHASMILCACWKFYSSWIWYHAQKVSIPKKKKKKKKENHLHVIFYAKRKRKEKKKKHLSSGSGTRSFNIALNTTLAYIYNYTSGIWFFFF